MTWQVTADVDEFDEAVDYFRALVPMTQAEFDAIEDAARARAFTIAAQLELHAVQTVYSEAAKALKDGTPYEEFEGAVNEALGKLAPDGHLLETVFINANQQSYNVGRYDQMNEPELQLLRPWRMFDAVLDGGTTPHCKAWDGVIRGHDDPCWLTHSPQCHHRCRSCLRSLRDSEARARGITYTLPTDSAAAGFGQSPALLRGTVPSPNKDNFDGDVWAEFQRRLTASRIDLDAEKARIAEERSQRDSE